MNREASNPGAVAGGQDRPVRLDLRLTEQVVDVAWADGTVSSFPGWFLRCHCPCAQCRTEREKGRRSLLPILSSDPTVEVRMTGGHAVGNYALQLDWSDGHGAGIYDFRLLRALCAELPAG